MAGFEINKRAIENMQREIAKEFERAARKHPIRVPVQVDAPEIPSASPVNAGIEKDPHLSRLLVWLDDLAALQPGVAADVSSYVDSEGLPSVEAKTMALQLEQHGLVEISRDLSGTDSQVFLTDEGTLAAQRLRTLQTDSVARFVQACDALLYWLFQTGRGRELVEVMAFVEAPGSYFAGDSLSVDEILGALEHLTRRGLVHRAQGVLAVVHSLAARETSGRGLQRRQQPHHPLEYVSGVPTNRVAVRQEWADRTVPRFLHMPSPRIKDWTTAHGDLHIANLTSRLRRRHVAGVLPSCPRIRTLHPGRVSRA